MIKETIKIDGMSCSHCVKSVEQALSSLNLENQKVFIGSAEISYEPNLITKKEIIESIENAGYTVLIEDLS